MVYRHRNPLTWLLLMTLMVFASGPSARRSGGTRQDRCQDGIYTVILRGYYSGKGTAEVRQTSVRIDAEVKSEDGQVGRLRGDFPTSGPYFAGQGTIMRSSVTMAGRLDAPKASRVVATFWDPTGHSARLVATLPSDTGDETWDDDLGN